jgi:hypothetical protein
MFVQVIQGRVGDAEGLRAQMDKWKAELAPGADGWLGSTGGVTADGRFVALARFESEEAARRNSDRPEQGEWWAATAACLDGEAEFHDSTWVDVDEYGDLDTAGFVQVMQGRTSDPERGRKLMQEDTTDWSAFRPDMLGSVMLHHDGDGWTMAAYFTSEAEARVGEKQEPPAEAMATMNELNEISIGETTYYDLTDPWLESP